MESLEFFLFRLRDPVSGEWAERPYRLTEEMALKLYGAGNYERIETEVQVRIDRKPANTYIA